MAFGLRDEKLDASKVSREKSLDTFMVFIYFIFLLHNHMNVYRKSWFILTISVRYVYIFILLYDTNRDPDWIEREKKHIKYQTYQAGVTLPTEEGSTLFSLVSRLRRDEKVSMFFYFVALKENSSKKEDEEKKKGLFLFFFHNSIPKPKTHLYSRLKNVRKEFLWRPFPVYYFPARAFGYILYYFLFRWVGGLVGYCWL